MISLSKCATIVDYNDEISTKFFHYNGLFPETPVRNSSKKEKKPCLRL